VGTTIDAVAVARPHGVRRRADARLLADQAARDGLRQAGLDARDIDLLVYAGIYHDRLLGEPALAALIQQDIGANPEDPHPGHHGTFSFDVANGGCGMLDALLVADGFLAAGTAHHVLVVASDSHPGRRWAHRFPYLPTGAALVCSHTDGPGGLRGFRFAHAPGPGGADGGSRATVALDHGRNRLHISGHACGPGEAALAAQATGDLLAALGTAIADVDVVVANPLQPAFLDSLVDALGAPADRVVTAPGEALVHTAGLAVALGEARRQDRLTPGATALLVSAGAGPTAGVALLTVP
jgi:3-oxoacyl-[acyl-carrier-protein] synthase-3